MNLGHIQRFALLAGAIVSLGVCVSGCKDDIILPEPRGIEGVYSGMLFITQNLSSGALPDSQCVQLTIRLGADNQAGSYSLEFDSSSCPVDTPIFCNIPRGDWSIKDGKVFLAPGDPDGSITCNELLVPNSFPDNGGNATEIGFGFFKIKNPPVDSEIGDSLIIRQDRPNDDMLTVFKLVLDVIP